MVDLPVFVHKRQKCDPNRGECKVNFGSSVPTQSAILVLWSPGLNQIRLTGGGFQVVCLFPQSQIKTISLLISK